MNMKKKKSTPLIACAVAAMVAAVLLGALAVACSGERALKSAGAGKDFIDEARWIYVALACGDGPMPDGVDAAARARHCATLTDYAKRYRTNFIEKSRPFFDEVVPRDAPGAVVYPFGGSDVCTTLATFPNATEITTISLENAGDPRMIPRDNHARQRTVMAQVRKVVGTYLLAHDNSNTNIHDADRILLGGQLTFSLVAAVIFGLEPVSVRYFRIEPDGALHYYTPDEISALEHVKGTRLHRAWVDLNYSVAFRNVEVVYRRKGVTGARGILVHRHMGANLHDSKFANSPLLAHLRKKGKVSAMTKAASYLLWYDSFSAVRNYLLQNMVFMISDSTGILPHHAQAAGFEQITYGSFNGAFLANRGGAAAAELRVFWKARNAGPLKFRYGYSDDRGASHLLITRPRKS
ncbi:MAG TPA: hypothetical protein PKM65_09920 [Spirochaetota bacterium]|nr:hypothetical protein [Spirochaetota bacterium]HNT12386.1 hypothetical protein [Spirochaetota bacterium]